MTLPDWTDDGLLPPGAHPASMSDLYERLVLDAPNRERRELLYGALTSYLRLMRDYVPRGVAWIDGGFVMHKHEPPHDVDIVVFPDDWSALNSLGDQQRQDLYGLLTLHDVILGEPLMEYVPRVQPIGGLLDGFLGFPSNRDEWFATWSRVKRGGIIEEGTVKGFVEVTW